MNIKIEGSLEVKSENLGRVTCDIFRHSKSSYANDQNLLEVLGKLDSPVDVETQVVPDLSEKGVKLAQDSARQYFNNLKNERKEGDKPETLFVYSSTMARALETNNIFIEIAENEFGHKIVVDDGEDPEFIESEFVNKFTKSKLRAIKCLSLRDQELPITVELFNVETFNLNWEKYLADANTPDEKVRREYFKSKWEEAHAMVMDNFKKKEGETVGHRAAGGERNVWQENYLEMAPKINAMFPPDPEKGFPGFVIVSSDEAYKKEFENIKSFVRRGTVRANKYMNSHPGEKVKMLAMTHEHVSTGAIIKLLGQVEGQANCEKISLEVSDNGEIEFQLERKGVVFHNTIEA